MVKLTRIYTRTGDDGSTGLGDGSRVTKTDPRIEACGTVDEANAAIGVAAVECEGGAVGSPDWRIWEILARVQQDLFDLGADLCHPVKPGQEPGASLRVLPEQTGRLETEIDEINANLSSLSSFVLPGGSALAAQLHVARTVVRRAERAAIALRDSQSGTVNPETIRYLNRLSDLLFVAARLANHDAGGDVLWVPGANRNG